MLLTTLFLLTHPESLWLFSPHPLIILTDPDDIKAPHLGGWGVTEGINYPDGSR